MSPARASPTSGDLDRVVLPDLARVDVELDQPRRRDREGDALPVGGRRPVREAVADREEDVGRRGERVPERRCRVADVWPVSSCVSSIAPLPFHVVTTGAPSRSASAVTSAQASARIAPPPATITGRRAVARSVGGALDVVGRGPDPAARLALFGIRQHDLGGFGLDVHRQVEEDRARAARTASRSRPGGGRTAGRRPATAATTP